MKKSESRFFVKKLNCLTGMTMDKSESHSVHKFFIKEGEEPFFEVGIDDPKIWKHTKIRIECEEFKLEISLPRKVMDDIMDLVHDVDMLEVKEKTKV